MIERLIYKAIEDGIAEINNDITLLDRLFLGRFLLPGEIEKIKAYWINDGDAAHKGPPSVYHGFPRVEPKFPAYFIGLANERESDKYLGDDLGEGYGEFLDDEENCVEGFTSKGMNQEHVYHVLVLAQHADVAIYYYEILKALIISQSHAIRECGIGDIHLSGADLAPNTNLGPEGFIGRRLAIQMTSEYTQLVPDEFANRAWKVEGLHIDEFGAPTISPSIEIKDNVNVYGSLDDAES